MAFSFVTSGVKLDGQGNAILTDSPTPSGSATLTDRQAYGQRRCACCSLPGCNLWCSGCDIQDVGKIRTFYCSRECQVKHRPDHKANCTARLHLARAASICFELFVAFEKATHIKTTEKVAEKNGVVTIGREDGDMRPWSGGSLFLQYPEEVLPSGTPAELMASILLDQTCAFCKSIEVAAAPPKNMAKILYCYSMPSMQGDVDVRVHSVLKLGVGGSGEYVLDLSGGQFGWTDILYDWSTFSEHRIQKTFVEIQPLLAMNRDLLSQFGIYPLNSIDGAQLVLRRAVMNRFMAEVQTLLDWYFDPMGFDGVRALQNLIRSKDFQAGKSKFLKRAIDYPREQVKGLMDIGKMYMSKDCEPRVALSAEEAAKYVKVWFEAGDERVKKRNVKDLMALWRKRMDAAGRP